MRVSQLLIVVAVLVGTLGCGTLSRKDLLRLEDFGWIQPGRTTKDEVVTRLGEPGLAVKVEDGNGFGQYAEYSAAQVAERYGSKGAMGQLEPRPRGGLPQVYQPPIETLRAPPSTSHERRLWILYDAAGVVRDFGVGSPSSPTK